MTKSIEITSWQSFVDQIDELSRGLSERPWFRGQPEVFPLTPHLLRHLRRRGVSTAHDALAIEAEVTKEFRRAAHLYLPTTRVQQLEAAESGAGAEGRSLGLVAWWTIMRHHRAPTRLLDWTLSPYVAAYFASESPLNETEPPTGVVWVLDFGAVRRYMDQRYPGNAAARTTDELLQAPSAPNDLVPLFHDMPTERMLIQQGCFTVCRNVLGDHGEIIEEAAPGALTRLVIPDPVKPDFRRRLRQMNLTAHSMFGDLDGLGRHAEEIVAMLVDDRSAD